MKRLLRLGFIVALASGALAAAAEEGDVRGAADHWLFTRMPGFLIGEYSDLPFDSHQFVYAPGSPRIEGHKTVIRYWVRAGTEAPTALQICRNHAVAIVKSGGTVIQDNGTNAVTVMLRKD